MSTLPACDLVLFGGTGDLALRKLLPALYRRAASGALHPDSHIIGAARGELSEEAYRERVRRSCETQLRGEFNEATWQAFAARVSYCTVDAQNPADFARLAARLRGREARIRVFFLSTGPELFAPICTGLAEQKLATPQSRIVLEKPLGRDRASSAAINQQVAQVFDESQIFRIDHYLGKETVQNLLALRFGNTLFEPLWRRGRIQHVQITVAEELGVERRAPFYDATGALRDMMQNHLLQLLCIIAMEPPATSDPDAMRDEKVKVLRALRPLFERDVVRQVVTGQYTAGEMHGASVAGYRQERDVPADSTTETFVALKAFVDSWRWVGVPFYLRTGKRLPQRRAEIVVSFEDVPIAIYDCFEREPTNRLVMQLQPEESIKLTIRAKHPGAGMCLKPVDLSLDFAEVFKAPKLDGYERLLTDIINGSLTLFLRHDEVDLAWRWIDPIREAWRTFGETPKAYPAGAWGPPEASELLARDGFTWVNEH